MRTNKPTCTHCGWLKSMWKISEIDTNHRTEDCMRKISKDVRAVIEENVLEQDVSEEDDPSDDNQGQSTLYFSNNKDAFFQKPDPEMKKPVLNDVNRKEEIEKRSIWRVLAVGVFFKARRARVAQWSD